jgi:drug/metabolite transporter (DMT)-like permease
VRGRLGETLRALSPGFVLRCGSLFVLYVVLLYLALGLSVNRSQVLEVALVHYLWPMLTLFFSALSLRLRPHPLFWGGGVLAMVGVGLALTQDRAVSWQSFQANLTHNAAPYLIAVAAAFSWALYSVSSRRWSSDAHGGAVALWMLLTGVVLGLARLLFPEMPQPGARLPWEVGFMALSSNLAYGFWERAMRKGNVILVVSASYFTPLLSTLVSSLYLGVSVNWRLWLGCALVVCGAVVCNLTREKSTQLRGTAV